MSFDNGQFFKPTGFENRFEADPVVPLENLRTSHKKDVEEAVRHVNGQADKVSALSMSLEPGSGKTTVLPFRFPTSSVCVVLPTGFDAFCAFRLASGPANINTGKYTEDNKANVTYMDSYTAGFMCFKHKGSLPFQIIIIDESDSNAGITKTLTEVKFRDSYVIHLSGTPEGREMLSTSGFEIEMYGTLPELSETYFDAVDFIKTRADGKRGMVMVPNSKVARQIHNMLKNSKIIDTDTTVDELDALVKQQSGNDLIVADDSCVRGFNLNLDIVFDFQRTGAGESERNITRHEHQQRRMRVGRLKPGVYYFTPVEYSSTSFTQWDVFRNNVAREVFGLPLQECSLSVDKSRLGELMVSRVEPYDLQLTLPDLVDVSKEPTPAKERPRRRSSALSDEAPAWVLWASGYKGKLSKKHSRGTSGSSTGSKAIASSSASSSTGSSVKPSHSVSVVGSPTSKPTSITTAHGSATVSAKATGRELVGAVGGWTPTIDLSTGSCEDWPDALRAAYLKGDKLCMVKPGAWVYTSREDAVDHKKTLLDIEIKGPTFTKPEMETVCRAWNVLVSRMNFGFAQGKDAWGDSQHVGFVLDYFSAYNDMMFN